MTNKKRSYWKERKSDILYALRFISFGIFYICYLFGILKWFKLIGLGSLHPVIGFLLFTLGILLPLFIFICYCVFLDYLTWRKEGDVFSLYEKENQRFEVLKQNNPEVQK